MPQGNIWEKEYLNPKLVSQGEARTDVKDFVRFLRREAGVDLEASQVLDLGCGTGSNALYFAEKGSKVIGIDISPTAIKIAKERAQKENLDIEYRVGNIGAKYSLEDSSIDIVLDVMSSNSLNESERDIYLNEVVRVLKPGGYLFVRGLSKDGDKNAKNLLKSNPGPEKDTYKMPRLNLVERVFSEVDFRALYGKFFEIHTLVKKTNYVRINERNFKRNYWISVLRKNEA